MQKRTLTLSGRSIFSSTSVSGGYSSRRFDVLTRANFSTCCGASLSRAGGQWWQTRRTTVSWQFTRFTSATHCTQRFQSSTTTQGAPPPRRAGFTSASTGTQRSSTPSLRMTALHIFQGLKSTRKFKSGRSAADAHGARGSDATSPPGKGSP